MSADDRATRPAGDKDVVWPGSGVDAFGLTLAAELAAPHGLLPRALAAVNALMAFLGMIALLVAACVLTYSVFSRYLFKAATDWQDEVAVFCIVGAVFLAGAWVQAQRGHIGIEAVAAILPPAINRLRRIAFRLGDDPRRLGRLLMPFDNISLGYTGVGSEIPFDI